MRTQIATLQKENKQKDEDHAKALMDMRRDAAVEKALTGAGAKNLTAARALLAAFLETAKVGEDGSVPGLDEELKKLSGAEETAFLFAPKDAGPSLAGAKPAGGGAARPPIPSGPATRPSWRTPEKKETPWPPSSSRSRRRLKVSC